MTTVGPAYIDKEINKRLLSLSNLRAQRNSYLPIFRLPPEILATIFTHGARNDYYESSGLPIFHVPYWVNVSYVCHHWRNVALNCPTLWTYHFAISLRWTEELLARSKQASLKIRISYDVMAALFRLSGLVEELLGHAERIQELHLLRVPPTALPSKLSLRAPRLQILDIDGSRGHPFEWNLEIDDAPLRTLKLTDCSLPWHTFSLSGLTTLFLRRVPARKQNVVEFLAILNCMQRLKILHLDNALTSARGLLSSGTFDVSPTVNLPCLARFLVVAPLSTVVALLSRVSVPLKTEFRLAFQPEQGSSIEDYAQLPPFLTQRFSLSNDLSSFSPTIRSLVIRFPESEFTLCASTRDDCNPHVSMANPEWDSDFPLVISVGTTPSMTPNEWDQITSGICCSTPLVAVRTLRVILPPFSTDFWRKTLGHFRRLQKMSLSEGYMPNLVDLLGERAKTPKGHVTADGDPAASYTFVPALSRLELYRITFAPEGAEFPLYTSVSKTSLVDALATREAGFHIAMVACNVETDSNEESDSDDDEASDYY